MFSITDGKGFQIKFQNGCTISVQWGPGNYCDHYEYGSQRGKLQWESTTAEVAILLPNGEFYRIQEHDDVMARQTPEEVAKWIEVARNLQPSGAGGKFSPSP